METGLSPEESVVRQKGVLVENSVDTVYVVHSVDTVYVVHSVVNVL